MYDANIKYLKRGSLWFKRSIKYVDDMKEVTKN
jgi:hypothetical protein